MAASAEFRRDGELPWKDEYAELVSDRHGLVAALRYRHELALGAQLDPDLPEEEYRERVDTLAERTRGVRRILARYVPVRAPYEGVASASA